VAAALGLLAALAGRPADGADAVEAERCVNLIAIFDQIVVNRFDYRTLAIPDRQFQEARRLRWEAEADCQAGETWLGVRAIEDALFKVGFVPWDQRERRPFD
jgi:hypothetical protein